MFIGRALSARESRSSRKALLHLYCIQIRQKLLHKVNYSAKGSDVIIDEEDKIGLLLKR